MKSPHVSLTASFFMGIIMGVTVLISFQTFKTPSPPPVHFTVATDGNHASEVNEDVFEAIQNQQEEIDKLKEELENQKKEVTASSAAAPPPTTSASSVVIIWPLSISPPPAPPEPHKVDPRAYH